jgi:hypothetical protein
MADRSTPVAALDYLADGDADVPAILASELRARPQPRSAGRLPPTGGAHLLSYVKPRQEYSAVYRTPAIHGSYHGAAGPQVGKKAHFAVSRSARARLKNGVTPQIMVTTEIRRPTVPGRVMSPKPVVVSVVTVKYSASQF